MMNVNDTLKKNPLYAAAFGYMVAGYSVIPLGIDKKPMLKSWKAFQEAAATDEQLALWWTRWPHANVGIITGAISKLTVVDIDDPKAVPLATFPQTYTVTTPSGGYHLYYRYDKTIQQTANTFPQFPHVDIRNDGGYIVAPPSHCEYIKDKRQIKGEYEITARAEIEIFPALLFAAPARAPSPKPSLEKVLQGFSRMAEGDGRNVALTKVVGKILKITPDESVAWALTLSTNKQFKKPLEESEARIIFDSILKKERTQSGPLPELELLRTDKGNIIVNTENVYRTLIADPAVAGQFRFNTFTGSLEVSFGHPWEPFQRADVVRVRAYLMRTYAHFVKVSSPDVEDSIIRVFDENKVSPPVEWFKSLVWDGVPRLDTWLQSAYNTPDDVYHRAVASNWLKGLVKRLVHPGCKFDYVLVLEGRQGIRKSTSLAVLGGDWHVETVFSPDNKDFFMLFAGKAIVEFSEGETLSRTEAKKLKAVITMQHDKYRPPYDRSAKEFPRQCIFAMTTNQEQYLKDETGNRRWLPVRVLENANIDWLRDNREQLFAEAYHRVVNLDESTHEFPEKETREQQEMRQIGDPKEEVIAEWYYTGLNDAQREEGISTRQAYIFAVKRGYGDASEMSRSDEMTIGSILREGLKLERKRAMINGLRFYMYYPSTLSEANKPSPAAVEHIKSKSMDF